MLTTSNVLAPAMPQSVFRAVQLMYVGAAAPALIAVVDILIAPRVGVLRIGTTTIVESHTRQVVMSAFIGAVNCATWLWMASRNKRGRAWARVLSTIFFAVFCIGAVEDLGHGAIEVRAVLVVNWLIALAVIIQLWRPESGPFYGEPQVLVKVR